MADMLLTVEGLCKTYGQGEAATRALSDVSFELDHGEFAAIIGQSGSGKSTLLNLIGLLDRPDCGEVSFRGRAAGTLDRSARAGLRNDLIGFVFQFHYLLPEFSVHENVIMPALISRTLSSSEIRNRADEALEMLGLAEYAHKNANQLSGGQKQRVAIARALMNRPALVLADEPTGNLDTVNTDLVYRMFREIASQTDTAFLIVTHDRGVAQRTDRVLEVSDGRLVADVRNDYLNA